MTAVGLLKHAQTIHNFKLFLEKSANVTGIKQVCVSSLMKVTMSGYPTLLGLVGHVVPYLYQKTPFGLNLEVTCLWLMDSF
jgi:hypothetical protein